MVRVTMLVFVFLTEALVYLTQIVFLVKSLDGGKINKSYFVVNVYIYFFL